MFLRDCFPALIFHALFLFNYRAFFSLVGSIFHFTVFSKLPPAKNKKKRKMGHRVGRRTLVLFCTLLLLSLFLWLLLHCFCDVIIFLYCYCVLLLNCCVLVLSCSFMLLFYNCHHFFVFCCIFSCFVVLGKKSWIATTHSSLCPSLFARLLKALFALIVCKSLVSLVKRMFYVSSRLSFSFETCVCSL